MKFLKQFLIILFVSFLGEILNYLIPLPIPASIYGILIMFLALELHIIPLSAVRDAGRFLIEIMPVMFIPAAVGLLKAWGILKPNWLTYTLIMFATTFIGMILSGWKPQKHPGKGVSSHEGILPAYGFLRRVHQPVFLWDRRLSPEED